MSENTKIQWADHTWSPWLGCRRVSEECDNCYIVETPVFKFRGLKHGKERQHTSAGYWKQPIKWSHKAANDGIRPRVFPSLCDPFDTEVSEGWFIEFMDLIVRCPNVDWLLLTKRPENAVERGRTWANFNGYTWTGFPPNVWLGVSCGTQKAADERIPILLSIQARIRFLSVEPMLGPIRLTSVCGLSFNRNPDHTLARVDGTGIDWVIVGGESGKNARPCNVDWIRAIVQQCQAAGVPPFVKQLGARPYSEGIIRCDYRLEDPKGGDPDEWAEDLRVRELPCL